MTILFLFRISTAVLFDVVVARKEEIGIDFLDWK